MAYTETTTQSWGSRLAGAFKGIIVGLILILASFILLWWNEGRAVKTTKALEEGQACTVELPDISKVDSAMNGQLLHASGDALTQDVLTDATFGISHNGIRLVREVEFYQWVEESHSETHKNAGGSETTTTTYTYKKEWTDRPVSSGSFKEPGHDNTVFLNVDDEDQVAQNVTFGAYTLSAGQIARIGNRQAYKLDEYVIPADLKGRAKVENGYLYVGYPVNNTAAYQMVSPEVQQLQLTNQQLQLNIQQLQLAMQNPQVPAENRQQIQLNIQQLQLQIQQNNLRLQQLGAAPVQQPAAATAPVQPAAAPVVVAPGMPQPTAAVQPMTPPAVVQPGMPQPGTVQPAMPQQPGTFVQEACSVDPGNPRIGDVRVKWSVISPKETISIVAQQQGSTFVPYVAKSSGYTVSLLGMGVQSTEQMYQKAHDDNTMMTWLLRFGGWLMMLIGFNMLFRPFVVLADVLPFLGDLIGSGTGFLSFVLASILSLITIALAWLAYRPVLGCLLLAVVGYLVYLVIKRKKAAKAAKEAAPAIAETPAAPAGEQTPSAE